MVVMPLNPWSSHKANCSGNLLCCDKCSYTTKLKGSLKRHHASIHEPTGTNFRTTNGEHHEALHHSLKMFERKKNLHMQKKLGSFMNQPKSLISISTYNVLRAGFIPQQEFRLRKRKRTDSESSSGSPSSSPVKR